MEARRRGCQPAAPIDWVRVSSNAHHRLPATFEAAMQLAFIVLCRISRFSGAGRDPYRSWVWRFPKGVIAENVQTQVLAEAWIPALADTAKEAPIAKS